MEDLVVLLLVVIVSSLYLIYGLFVHHEGTFNFWLKLQLQNRVANDSNRSFEGLDPHRLIASLPPLPPNSTLDPNCDETPFVLNEVSEKVCRSLWRIVEYTMTDFVDYWYVKISDDPEFGNDRTATRNTAVEGE